MNNNFNKQLDSKLKSIASHKNIYEKFKDFVDFSFWSLSNTVYKNKTIEDKYISLANTYKKDEMLVMSEILSILVLEMEKVPNDYLGDFLMSIGGGDDFKGQYFTPQHICDLMSEIVFFEKENIIKQKGYITLLEPACGTDAMIIGFYKVMLKYGYNPQTQLYIHATDLCNIVYKICYIQLTILGVSATVVNGNSLSLEEFDKKNTPFYYLNNWEYKLQYESINEKLTELSVTSDFKILVSDNISTDTIFPKDSLKDLKQDIMVF